jgi:hypothetical protein
MPLAEPLPALLLLLARSSTSRRFGARPRSSTSRRSGARPPLPRRPRAEQHEPEDWGVKDGGAVASSHGAARRGGRRRERRREDGERGRSVEVQVGERGRSTAVGGRGRRACGRPPPVRGRGRAGSSWTDGRRAHLLARGGDTTAPWRPWRRGSARTASGGGDGRRGRGASEARRRLGREDGRGDWVCGG